MVIDLAKNALVNANWARLWLPGQSSRSGAARSLFNRVLNFGDIGRIVETYWHRVVEIHFPIWSDDPVSIGLDPLEDRLMRFADRLVGTMMDRGCERLSG
jgi:hypothetical protein